MGLANGIHWHSQWHSPPTDSKINIRRLIAAAFLFAVASLLSCLKKVPTIKLSVTLVKSQPIFKILALLKAYEICYKIYMTLPTSP